MSGSSISNLWRTLTNLSGTDALLLGFLLLCAVGGALVAIYVAISALLDARRERRAERRHQAAEIANRHT
jgi:hypothetical protein